MASEVSIANSALQKIGADRIVSLTEDSRNARAVNACYTEMRDAELEAHPWNCAKKRVQLSADTDTPPFDGETQYSIPTDCLRVILPRHADWQLENGKILTNTGAPLDFQYVRRVTDPNQMPATLREAIACRIAIQICEQITQSNAKIQVVEVMYKKSISEARRTNAMQNIATEFTDDDWILARL